MNPPNRRARLANASRGHLSGGDDEKPPNCARDADLTPKGKRTRQRLLDAARGVFEDDGFLHARISDICSAAETSHGSFYTYFSSKEEIFKEVTNSVELNLLKIESATSTTESGRVREANQRYLTRYREHAKILSVIRLVASFDLDVRSTRIQRQDAFASVIERRIRKLQSEGRADVRLDPDFTANALGGMVAFVAEQIFINGRPFDEEFAADQLTLLWTNAIGLSENTDPIANPSDVAQHN